MSGRAIVILALCVFTIAWFVPVHEELGGTHGGLYGPSPRIDDQGSFQEGTPPGWRACVTAWDYLTADWVSWRVPVLGVTCFTNVGMLAALILVLLGIPSRALGYLLIFCAVLNAGWVYLPEDPSAMMEDLRVGYYLWVVSFAIAGVGVLWSSRCPCAG